MEYTSSQSDQAIKMCQTLQEQKVEISAFEYQRLDIEKQLSTVNSDLDKKQSQILNIEHFMDRYIPIRIQQQIAESIKAISGRTQLLKYENFEMEKYKVMNQEVLSDEQDQSLKEICKRLLKDITQTVEQFKKLAKQKGINYDAITTTNKSNVSKEQESNQSLHNSSQH